MKITLKVSGRVANKIGKQEFQDPKREKKCQKEEKLTAVN